MIVIPNKKDNFKKFKTKIALLRDKFDINVEDFSIYSYSAKIFYNLVYNLIPLKLKYDS